MSLIRPWKCNIQNRIRESKLAAVQIGGYLCHLGMRSDCAEHLDVKADISSASSNTRMSAGHFPNSKFCLDYYSCDSVT